MRGVVLSGGLGTRLRPITYSMTKQLVPVGNKPILFYGLEALAEAGIEDVAVVISPETGGEVRETLQDGSVVGLRLRYVIQPEPLGIAHALRLAIEGEDPDDVLLFLGDNILRDGVAGLVHDFRSNRPAAQVLLAEVDDPRAFGVAALDENGAIARLVEKPADPPSNLALVGAYLFDPSIAEALAAITPSGRGQYEITDAIQHVLDAGKTVGYSLLTGWWKDTGKKHDLLAANELVLADLVGKVEGEVVGGPFAGPVRVAEGARLEDCTVTGPAIIGEGAELTRVIVGPNTAIGAGCRLTDASVANSIILEGSEVAGWKLHHSLLGRDCRLAGTAPTSYVDMVLGERSEIRGE